LMRYWLMSWKSVQRNNFMKKDYSKKIIE